MWYSFPGVRINRPTTAATIREEPLESVDGSMGSEIVGGEGPGNESLSGRRHGFVYLVH
jgi:hypothetical protein